MLGSCFNFEVRKQNQVFLLFVFRLGASAYKGHVEFPWSSFKETSVGTAIDLMVLIYDF